MKEMLDLLLTISIPVVIVTARFVLDKMVDTASTKVRFSMGMILMILYTFFMMVFVYSEYESMIHNGVTTVEEFYRNIMAGIACINFALMLVAIFYYFMNKKRKISDLDKMKLKDL